MFDYYQGYPKEQIELLASLPSFGIMIMLLLNGFLEKYFLSAYRLVWDC